MDSRIENKKNDLNSDAWNKSIYDNKRHINPLKRHMTKKIYISVLLYLSSC